MENLDTASALAAPDSDPGQLPPLVPPGASATIEQQMEALQKQVAALLALQQGTLQFLVGAAGSTVPAAAKPTDDQLAAVAAAEPMPAAKPLPRVKIVLEDNDAIAPGGQFISIDGVPYLLQPNFEVEVPVNLLDVLDHAIMSVPVTDENKNVVGYRDRLRFPYRVVREATRI